MQFHPKNTPETISEGQKSKIFLGGACPQTPLAGALRALKSHTGTPLFKILDSPLVLDDDILLVVIIWRPRNELPESLLYMQILPIHSISITKTVACTDSALQEL